MRATQRQATNMLLIIGVMALAYVAWYDHHLRDTRRHVATLVPYALDEINEFTIERPNTARITLRKVGANWSLVHPIEHPARAVRVRALLQLLKQPVNTHHPIHRADLNALGLKPPQAELTLYDRSLRFGHQEPTSGQRYLRVVDDIILVDDYFYQLISSGVNAFAKLELLDNAVERAVNQVSLNGSPIDFDAVAWTYAKAAAIQPVDPSVTANTVVSVRYADGSGQRFALREHAGEHYGLQPEGQGFEFLIDQSLAALLGLSPAS